MIYIYTVYMYCIYIYYIQYIYIYICTKYMIVDWGDSYQAHLYSVAVDCPGPLLQHQASREDAQAPRAPRSNFECCCIEEFAENW